MKNKIFKIIYIIIMLLLTFIYAILMTCLAGAGLIYNGGSYGADMVHLGYGLIASGVLMTAGAVLSLFKGKRMRIIVIIAEAAGLALCMVLLYILCRHADSAGWSDNYTMLPVSSMYRRRIMPVIVPAIMTIFYKLIIDN